MTTILYIEDNALDLRLVNKYLVSLDYTILGAINGQTGLEMIQQNKPDLILLDINLPDVNGLEYVHHLKSLPETLSIPVIALTANAMVGDKEQCLEAGCNGYISKPIVRQELYNMIQHFLSDKQSI